MIDNEYKQVYSCKNICNQKNIFKKGAIEQYTTKYFNNKTYLMN